VLVVLSVLLSVLATLAGPDVTRAASGPVVGGRYDGRLTYGSRCPKCHSHLTLVVADDGQSFLEPSKIDFTAPCSPTSKSPFPPLPPFKDYGSTSEVPRATEISATWDLSLVYAYCRQRKGQG
jgi:hypothetical protein